MGHGFYDPDFDRPGRDYAPASLYGKINVIVDMILRKLVNQISESAC